MNEISAPTPGWEFQPDSRDTASTLPPVPITALAQQPYHPRPGTSKERQEVGDPGHCEDCLVRGHVAAHPDLGCGDVGCSDGHDAADG